MQHGRVAGVAAVLVGLIFVGAVPADAHPKRAAVVASFYPLAWAARQVGGTQVAVADLTPSGAEPHDLELTTDDRDAIEDADLLIVLGGGFQPAVEQAAAQRDGPTLEAVSALDEADVERATRDPHIWLDPLLMRKVLTRTLQRLERLLPDRRGALRRRYAATDERLAGVDRAYREGLADCKRNLIVTSHEAFGWLARRYGLRQEAIAGIDPEVEPDPRRLGELADLAHTEGVTTIFTEDLVSPKVAETVAREAGGLRTVVLSPLESLSEQQRARADDYVTVMLENLEKLRAALGCR